MKVLQVVTDRDRRGAQVFALDLAAGLGELGSDVVTVALTSGRYDDSLPLSVLGPGRRSIRTLHALRRTAVGSDVVIAHGSATLLACAIGLAASVPFVYRQISDPLVWAGSIPRRARVALMIRRADVIVALAESVDEMMRTHYRLRRTPIVVIPNAVPAGRFPPPTAAQREACRARFHVDVHAGLVAYVGALVRDKAVDDLIAVSGTLGVDLLVVGDGPERVALEAQARAVAPGRVRFTGSLDDPLPALHAADIVVLPARGGDSMPAVLIEAGLCGLPVVATSVGAVTDIVTDQVTGRVVPPNDRNRLRNAIEQLLADPDRRIALGAAARRRCLERFTLDAVAPRWLAVIERVGDGQPAQPRGSLAD